jgi:hypothetical protein
MKLSRRTTGRIASGLAITAVIGLAGAGTAAGWPLHPGKSMYKGRVNDEGHRATVVVECGGPNQQTGLIKAGQTIGIVAGDHGGDSDPVNSSGKVLATLAGTTYTFTQFSPSAHGGAASQPLTGSAPCEGKKFAHFTSPGGSGDDGVKVIFVASAS